MNLSSVLPSATIYHNPRCSKSRQSFEILTSNGYAIEEVRYLEVPPSIEELAQLCHAMNVAPFEIVRTGEDVFKSLNLAEIDPENDQAWLKIMVENPKLIERPIVKIGERVVMGRPPENIEKLIHELSTPK